MLAAPVQRHEPDELAREAWKVADELGWAKTYDANYVALARLLSCKLVTLDARMRRGTRRCRAFSTYFGAIQKHSNHAPDAMAFEPLA